LGAVGGAVALHLRLVLDVRRRIAQERILERVPARHHALSEIFGEESGIEQVIRFIQFQTALKQTRSVCLRAF